MAETFSEIDVLDVGQLLLNHVLSDPYVDVALVVGRALRPGEPRFVPRRQAFALPTPIARRQPVHIHAGARKTSAWHPRSRTTSPRALILRRCTIGMSVEENLGIFTMKSFKCLYVGLAIAKPDGGIL